jgi:hypothetical protein
VSVTRSHFRSINLEDDVEAPDRFAHYHPSPWPRA